MHALCVHIDRDMSATHVFEAAAPPPPRYFAQVDFCVELAKPLTGAMDDHGGRVGAAARRRGRRLQAWHRHVKMAVAMELATALHHRHSPRGLWWQGQERWRSRTSTKRYGDRRLLHWGSGRSLLRKCPSPRRVSRLVHSTPWCRSWHKRTRGRWRRCGSSWLMSTLARPTSGTRSRTPPPGAVRGGRGRRGGQRSFFVRLHIPLVAALFADNGSGMLLAGFLQVTLCSLLTLAGLRCPAFSVGIDQKDRYAALLRPRSSPTSTVAISWLVLLVSCYASLRCPLAQDGSASWSVWTRRTRTQLVGPGFSGDDAPHTVFLSSCRQAQDALHHGQYRREGQLPGTSLSWCRGCFPWSSRTMDASQLPLDKVVYVPVMQVVQVVDVPFVPQMLFPMVQSIQQFTEVPQLQYVFLVVDVPVVLVVQILRCRRGEDTRAPTVAAR